MALVNRTYTPRTSRLLSEYLAANYPSAQVIQEMHLTLPNPGAVARAGGRVSPLFGSTILGYADAAVILPGEVQLWEAKDAISGAAMGQLEQYARWWPEAYESTQFPNRQLTLHLLAANDNPVLRAVAQGKGISVVVYKPGWYDQSVQGALRDSEARRLSALSQPILELVVEGHLTKDAAVAKLVALGMDYYSAVQRVDNAIAAASAPV